MTRNVHLKRQLDRFRKIVRAALAIPLFIIHVSLKLIDTHRGVIYTCIFFTPPS